MKGSRFVQGGGTEDMPRYRRFGNAVLVHIANLLFRLRYTDITYGFNATWRKHAEYHDFGDAHQQVRRFIEDVDITKRIHSSLGYLTPVEYEYTWWQSQLLEASP